MCIRDRIVTRGRQVKSLLFDLDGTLIKLDMAAFLPQYFKALGRHAARFIEPEVLIQKIMESTAAMINNLDPKLANKDVFEQDFTARSGLAAEEVLPLFDSFYDHVFPQLAGEEVQSPGAQEAVKLALERGLEVVVATNPVSYTHLPIGPRRKSLCQPNCDRFWATVSTAVTPVYGLVR